MKELPYFCWYPADAETDENFRSMTDAEVGFYLRCLNHSWINHGLPADSQERARIINRPQRYADKMWERVGRCFKPHPENPSRLVNPRQESERIHAKESQERKREGGRMTAAKRWGSDSLADSLAISQPITRASVSVSVSSSESNTTNTEKPSTRARAVLEDESWGKFRAAYPNDALIENDWARAKSIWVKLDWEQKIKAIEHVAACDPAYVKLPQNYLADREWERKPRPEPVRKSKLERLIAEA